MSMKCPLCVAAGKRRQGVDTRQHLFRECPETEASRVTLKKALVAALEEATENNISKGGARAAASAVLARDDYYAGQIDKSVKDIIDKDRENSAQGSWIDRKGQPLQIKRGLLQKEVVSSSLKMHCKRKAALVRMQMKAGDQPTAQHGQHFYMLAIRDSKIRKVLMQGIQLTQANPTRPLRERGRIGTGLVVITPGAPNAMTNPPPTQTSGPTDSRKKR
jgi:hypothetical protein